MNVIKAGDRFVIYGEEIEVYDILPCGTYNINFNKMSGWYLTKKEDLIITEEKIYGNSNYRVKKAIKSYKLTNRNFGVLLSGQKGIGKSLFVRMLAQEAYNENLPVLVISEPIHGLSDYISSIMQDCVVIFDEFEKTFADTEDWKPQDELLSLFDGIDGGHKLFIVTCNDLDKISPYMLNRPGRFHYHFSMMPPSAEEIREYLHDKILPEYNNIIEDIVNLAALADIPYDYLRAIAFDINQGYPLNEVMSELNITRIDVARFDLTLYLSNGLSFSAWNEKINLRDDKSYWINFRRFKSSEEDLLPDSFNISIRARDIQINDGKYVILNAEKGPWDESDFYSLDDDKAKEVCKVWNNLQVKRIEFTRLQENGPKRYLV